MSKKGLFVAVEGIDGIGKGTQATLLSARIENEGHTSRLIAFPRYGEPACADVEAYLRADFGDPDSIDPRVASKFYADDRLDAAAAIYELLASGTIVIADRYVDSNAGHQGGKILDHDERDAYLEWLYRLEYEKNGIPKPDLVIILYADADVGRRLLERRAQDILPPEGATGGHEKNLEHLRRARDAYLWLARREPGRYRMINCSPEGEMLSRDAIHELIYAEVEPVFQ